MNPPLTVSVCPANSLAEESAEALPACQSTEHTVWQSLPDQNILRPKADKQQASIASARSLHYLPQIDPVVCATTGNDAVCSVAPGDSKDCLCSHTPVLQVRIRLTAKGRLAAKLILSAARSFAPL